MARSPAAAAAADLPLAPQQPVIKVCGVTNPEDADAAAAAGDAVLWTVLCVLAARVPDWERHAPPPLLCTAAHACLHHPIPVLPGASLIGMILWPRAKRSISPAVARQIGAAARAHGAEPVAVFVDEDAATIER